MEGFSEKVLICNLKHKDDLDAFSKLYHHYKIKIFNFSFKLIKNKEDAEEVVQDVFVKVWENRISLDENLSFQSYLFTISKNVTLNKLRKRVVEMKSVDLLQPTYSCGNDTEQHALASDLEGYLHELIEQFPDKRKQVFKLKHENGLTYQEIADQLHISPRTVEVHISRSLKQIKKHLRFYVSLLLSLFSVF